MFLDRYEERLMCISKHSYEVKKCNAIFINCNIYQYDYDENAHYLLSISYGTNVITTHTIQYWQTVVT